MCENPDYMFYSLFTELPFPESEFDGVRILYSGENYSADFNRFDYCVGYDRLQYADRFIRMPIWQVEPHHCDFAALQQVPRPLITPEQLQGREHFCNFIYSHESDKRTREKMAELLHEYKRVECAGPVLNNQPGGCCAFPYDVKKELQSKCRFTIAFESTSLPGFCTEKILHAFETRTVPVYYGDPHVAETFNPKAFINCHDYDDFAQVAQRVREVDQDEELLLDMLNQPVFIEQGYIDNRIQQFEEFLVQIFSQPLENAYRRSRVFWGYETNRRLTQCNAHVAAALEKERALAALQQKRVNRWRLRAGELYREGGALHVIKKAAGKFGSKVGLAKPPEAKE